VKVVPRSSKNGVVGVVEGALKVNLNAPPVDGAANEALREVIARLCNLRKNDITIISGHTSRLKRLHLSTISLDKAKQLLGIT
jgi:uncharacterized protein (TIGR00251 family)